MNKLSQKLRKYYILGKFESESKEKEKKFWNNIISELKLPLRDVFIKIKLILKNS